MSVATEAIIKLIDKLFGATCASQERTVEQLEEIRDYVQGCLDAIE